MTAMVIWAICFGVGAILLLSAQHLGAPRPTLAERLRSLQPDLDYSEAPHRVPIFRTRLFEKLFRPGLEKVGRSIGRLLGRLGADSARLTRRLEEAGDAGGVALFLGQKLASGLIGLGLLPVGASLGAVPPTPYWVWLVLAATGFFLPDLLLDQRVRQRRLVLREGLAQVAELLALGVSAGLGLEQALDEVTRSGQGSFFDELRLALRETRVAGRGAGAAVEVLAQRTGLDDARSFAAAVRAAEQGAPLGQTLRSQARGIGERRRFVLLEAGERAQVRMVLPIGILILPAFFLLILYPAAVQLLRLAGP
jgi:tight adherence protein C